MAADPWPRKEGHEPERFGGSRVDHFPDIDAHLVAEHRHLVDECHVDMAERVLEQLGELGRATRRDQGDLVDELAIKERGNAASLRCGPSHDLGGVREVELFVPRVDALG